MKPNISVMGMSDMSNYNYSCLKVVDLGNFVFNVQLNRPEKRNAINIEIWREIGDAFRKIDQDPSCRVVLFTGNGKVFSSGIEFKSLLDTLQSTNGPDAARSARGLLRLIKSMQDDFSAIEKCCKPVIVAMHAYCLGITMDLIAGTDIRYCTRDTVFSIKEVLAGLATDVGSLNRWPKNIGNHSWLREACLTGRDFGADEAEKFGVVSRVFNTQEEMMKAAKETAEMIASSSPVAVQGTKIALNYARDHPVDDSLKFIALWNASQLQTEDLAQSAMAIMTKGQKPNFAKL